MHCKKNYCFYCQSYNSPVMSPPPIILIINLSPKSNQKPHTSELKLSKKQNFNFYINTFKKTSKECNTLARVCNHMNLTKKRSKINIFIISNFVNCICIYLGTNNSLRL